LSQPANVFEVHVVLEVIPAALDSSEIDRLGKVLSASLGDSRRCIDAAS
jgi:hypothetical protein